MSIQEIEQAIERLRSAELAELEEWFARRQSELWDEQISQDISAGKLDGMAAQAIADFKAGNCTAL